MQPIGYVYAHTGIAPIRPYSLRAITTCDKLLDYITLAGELGSPGEAAFTIVRNSKLWVKIAYVGNDRLATPVVVRSKNHR